MGEVPTYSITLVKGGSLRDSHLADKIIALDRKNSEAMLRAVGRDFPEDRRRVTSFHPSNRTIFAVAAQNVVGYVD